MHLFCLRSVFLTISAAVLSAAPCLAYSASTLTISSATYTVSQNAGAVVVYVKRSATADPKTGYADPATVGFSTANSTAVAGSQYTAKKGQLSWGKGDTSTKSIVIPISNATPFSGTKAFALAIASPSSGSTIATGSSIVTIDGDLKSGTTTKTASLSWSEPTTNTNGQALTNLAGYKILYGTSASALSHIVQITNPSTVSYSISNLTSGTWYFAVLAYNTAGVDSPPSATIAKTL